MALVKKLQSGGSPTPDLDDLINEEFSLFNFKTKDERQIRDAVVELRDYEQNNKGSFK